ncbi:WD40/YVTN/BNR-like repeat-containing protein [Micromonospora sp. CPCC 205558]|uniref:WD40/YVTN/BNR-like repeat-containing protein n=1 Tax=Micromonospora sp. CPCC 205558 TaxID=3122403 RepID=UPI002FEED0AD
MSEREFTGFDVDTVADAVRQPPLDDVRTVARARRRRRTSGVALGLVVAVAGVAMLPLFGNTGRSGWTGPDQPPVMPGRSGEFFLTGPDSAVVAGVRDADEGCFTVWFRHTDDGGRSWTDDETTRYRTTNQCGSDEEGNPLSNPEFSVLNQRSYLIQDGDQLRLSTDYGRTWADAEQAMVTVSSFPASAQPVFCQWGRGCGALREPLAVSSTGTVYRLGGKPPSPYPPASIYPSADGTIWVNYWPGDIGVMVVARSVDRGATWTTWQPAAGANVIAIAGVSAQEAYLLIAPPPPPGAQPMEVGGTSQLLRTTDGGRTWADMGTDLPNSLETRFLVVGSDGDLLLVEAGNMQPSGNRSTAMIGLDAGRRFKKMREYERRDGGVGAAPGHAWLYGRDDMTVSGADHVQLTADGTSWTRFPLPD